MDPFTIVAGLSSVIGLGAKLFGGIGQVEEQQKIAQMNAQVSGYEGDINEQKRTAMNIDARRRNMEMIRQSQLAQSMALTNATSQGAQFGSGLQGGYAQIQGQTGTNLVGLAQNYQIGQNIFDINSKISGVKSGIATEQGRSGMYSGISAIGGTLMGAANPIANLSKSFFGTTAPGQDNYNFNLTGGQY